MAYVITSDCTACGDCAQICPNQAVFPGNSVYQINAWLCTECLGYADEPQCASVCPADAIVFLEAAPLPPHPTLKPESTGAL